MTYFESRVYPRVCGATVRTMIVDEVDEGLSPRVRGNLPETEAALILLGSIPACAGQPTRKFCHYAISRVYPRVCGAT